MITVNAFIKKMTESNFATKVDKFCNTPWYPAAIGCVCILCHSLDVPVVGAALLTVLLVPALLFCKNMFVLAPFLTMCSFVISEDTMPQSGYFNKPHLIVVLCLLLVLILTAFVFNFVYYKRWKQFARRTALTVSMALVMLSLVVGGLFSQTFTFGGVATALSIGLTMILPYYVMICCGEYEGRKTLVYFAWTLITVSVVILAAVVLQYFKYDMSIGNIDKSKLMLGYSISNTAAAFVVIALPLTFYMAYIYKHGYLFLAVVALELVTIALTLSRASLVVAVPGSVIVAVALCFKKKTGRLWYWIGVGIAAAAALALVIVFRHALWDKLMSVFSGEVSDSGRARLLKFGFDAWKDHPVFGVGIHYLVCMDYAPTHYYSFHNTPMTFLYCAGIVGLAAYLYHRYKTVRVVFSARLTAERVFLALAILAMIVNALLDIAMTSPPHLLYYSIMLALIEMDADKIRTSRSANNTEGEQRADQPAKGENHE